MATLSLTCPHCQQPQAIPATIVTTDTVRGIASVKLDLSASEAHLAECRAKRLTAAPEPAALEGPGPTTAELAGRVDRFLAMRAYIAVGGSRACTMCGTNANVCMERLQAGSEDQARRGVPRAEGMGVPCCNACGNGNTHPAPGEAKGGCAEWAAEHHKADQ